MSRDNKRARNRAAHIRWPAQPFVRKPRQVKSAQPAIDFVTRVVAAQQLDVRRQASAISVGRHPSRRLVLLLTCRLAQQQLRRIAPQRPVHIRQLHVFTNHRVDRQFAGRHGGTPVAAAHESHAARNASHRRRALNRGLLALEVNVPSGRKPCRSAATSPHSGCCDAMRTYRSVAVARSSICRPGGNALSKSRLSANRSAVHIRQTELPAPSGAACHTPVSAE